MNERPDEIALCQSVWRADVHLIDRLCRQPMQVERRGVREKIRLRAETSAHDLVAALEVRVDAAHLEGHQVVQAALKMRDEPTARGRVQNASRVLLVRLHQFRSRVQVEHQLIAIMKLGEELGSFSADGLNSKSVLFIENRLLIDFQYIHYMPREQIFQYFINN